MTSMLKQQQQQREEINGNNKEMDKHLPKNENSQIKEGESFTAECDDTKITLSLPIFDSVSSSLNLSKVTIISTNPSSSSMEKSLTVLIKDNGNYDINNEENQGITKGAYSPHELSTIATSLSHIASELNILANKTEACSNKSLLTIDNVAMPTDEAQMKNNENDGNDDDFCHDKEKKEDHVMTAKEEKNENDENDSQSCSSSETSSSLLSSKSSSSSSLLSSSSPAATSFPSYTIQKRKLKRKFQTRNKILSKMTTELQQSSKFGVGWSQFLRQHEEAVQKEKMALLEERRKQRLERREKMKLTKTKDEKMPTEITVVPNPKNDKQTTSHNSSIPITTTIHRHLQFEFYHTLPAFFTLLAYCTAHNSVYELLNSTFSELVVRNYAKNYGDEFYFLLLILGLCLSRCTGGVFTWMSNDLYNAAKFDMHNRCYLSTWDARLFKALSRKYPRMKMVLRVISLYFCFISVGFYMQKTLPVVMDVRVGVLENLPSVVWRRELLLLEEEDNEKKKDEGEFDVFGCGEKTWMHEYLLEGYLSKRNLTLKECSMAEENGAYLEEEESYDDAYFAENDDGKDEEEDELPPEESCLEDDTIISNSDDYNRIKYPQEEDCKEEDDYEEKEHTATTKELARLSGKDETYLYSKITMSSYYALVGDCTTGIVNLRGTVVFHGILASLSLYVLKRVDVPFWE